MKIDKLKDMIQDCNINFLIGSGMSAPYLSTLWNIEILLTEIAKDDTLEDDERILIQTSLYKKFFDDVMKKNIQILKGRPSTKNVIKSYENFYSLINRLMLLRRNKLLTKQVNIFTTNIDICLEKAIENKQFEFNDGFNGRFSPKYDLSNFKKSIYKSSLHFGINSEIPIFNILKLHGSLTWSLDDKTIKCDATLSQVRKVINSIPDEDENFIEITKDDEYSSVIAKLPIDDIDNSTTSSFRLEYEKLPIVNPTKDKFRDTLLNQTYYELLRMYSNELEKENSLLFVMGFSFADEHIKELTLRVANSNPTLIIIIFCHSSKAKKEIETNIDISKVKNNNIIFESPTTSPKEDDEDILVDDFNYNFDTINNKIFKSILSKIEDNDE